MAKEVKGLEERQGEKEEKGRESVPDGFCDDKADDAGGIPWRWGPMAKTEASSLHSLPPDNHHTSIFGGGAEKM